MNVAGAKAAYVRGDIDASQLEQRVQDILDGTAERQHRERMRAYCDENGHAWVQRFGDYYPSKCAHCGVRYPI